MAYVDGYVLAVPEKNIAIYKKIAKMAGKIWREHGALEYRECVGDDLSPQFGLPFPKAMKVKPGETVVFSWIVFKSKAHRDSINKKVMMDPRITGMMDPKEMPFDCKRMVYGGFKVLVEA
jgi:uncharacterized protein YbaA (DUF1428 family)